ncbi:MAG: EamA family transporter [Spirochaetaceae bacterium]|nr:EamA family transporter [Spirochaetaceae bacterium]
MTDNAKTLFASFGMLLTAAIWGFAFVVVKDSLDIVPPIYMMAFRFTIASVVLSLVFFNKFKLSTKKILLHGFILGVLLFLAYAFQTIGCLYTTAGKNAFLTAIYVILVPFFLWIMTKRKPGIHVIFAALIALVGIGLLTLQSDFSVNIGDLLTLICGIGYAFHMIFISRFNKTEDPILLTILQLFTAAILSWIFSPIWDGGFPKEVFYSSKAIYSLLYLGLISTMIAFFLQNLCQKYTPPTIAALLLSLESVFGVLFSCIFLKEPLTTTMVIGCILIFFAIILAETKFSFLLKKNKDKPST